MKITIKGEALELDKERAVYFSNFKLLAISDLHLGKSAHFRKAGLQVPSTIAMTDLARLDTLIEKYKPNMLLVNGDMFHHDLNSEITAFASWRKQYKELNFILVKGNHDRLKSTDYSSMDIQFYEPCYKSGPFLFVHNFESCGGEELYPVAGHVHPGVTITGKARQRLRFPCFYFGEKYALLPAFSAFTGLYALKPRIKDRIFAITDQAVIEVQG